MPQSISPRRFSAQQNSKAVLPNIHCNEHCANDSMNHLPPNVSFGGENNRSVDCFLHAMIIIIEKKSKAGGNEHG
jgi:hypothetical protein